MSPASLFQLMEGCSKACAKGWIGMWEKLKQRIITVSDRVKFRLSLLPFAGALFWEFGKWFLEGRKVSFLEAVSGSLEFYVGVTTSAISLAYILFSRVTHLKEYLPKFEQRLIERLDTFEESLNDFREKLDKVESTGIEAIQTATGFIERAFGLQVMTDLRDRHSEAALEALQALGFNLRNWENHVTRRQNGKIVLVDDDKKIAVWLRYMRTYYFEEAFDVRRKELVTNGRNFCFILLATLQAFLEQLNGNEKLHYYAVTPVHPKDWYNWPHGYCKPRAYFEEDFVGLFYRVLRETLKSPEVKQTKQLQSYICA
jgi:hypothetical protein